VDAQSSHDEREPKLNEAIERSDPAEIAGRGGLFLLISRADR
jgi:hypothetical protein